VIRKAFVMSVYEGAQAEYARRHNPIWPELRQVFKAHGVANYSIFLHPDTLQLFAYAELESEAQWAAIAATQECRRWWQEMADLMPHNSDGAPLSVGLEEVFHLD
jgi:L-rhamnose mutarotase